MRRLVLGAAACGLLALILQVYAGYKRGSPITPGPATASLELVKRSYDPPRPRALGWDQPLPGRVSPESSPEEPHTSPSRTVEQVLFVGGSWLVVSRSPEGGLDLVALSADWSRSRRVTGFAVPPASRLWFKLVPDREWRRAIVCTGYRSDHESGGFAIDVAVLDVPHSRLRVLYHAPGSGPPGGDPAVWAGERIVVAHERAVTLIDPTTGMVREAYREQWSDAGAGITTLWPSPLGTLVTFDRDRARYFLESSRRAKCNLVVIDVAAGRGVPVANDSRPDYYHGVVKWESEDSLLFWVSGGSGKASLYRAKLRPAHADSR